MSVERKKILVADDDKLVIAMLSDLLDKEYDVITAADGKQALEKLRSECVDVIICDQMMPHSSGVEVLKECSELQPRAVRVLMTASEKVSELSAAVNLARVHRFIVKPFRDLEVNGLLRGALREVELERENVQLVDELRERERELERELEIRTQELKDVMSQMLNR